MTNPAPHGQVPAIQRYEDHAAAIRTPHVQTPAEIEHVAGDVSKTGAEANMTQQPAPATQQAGATKEHVRLVRVIADKIEDGTLFRSGIYSNKDLARFVRNVTDAAAPQFPTAQAAESVPAIQGEMNVQLDIDSSHSAPGQQRDVARSVALGQPMGNGQDQAAGRPSAQGDKLLTVAERNIRSFLRSAQFKGESDREAALNCVDVLWAAARAPAQSVTAPSETTPHPACKPDMLVNGGALILALNVLRRAGKHEVAGELEATAQPAPTAQADSVLEDAARYRWLRRWKGQEHEPPFTVQHEIDGALWGGDLDAAIDADRKQGATP